MPDAIAASVGSGQVIDALQYDFGSGQVIAVGAAAASSAAFARPYTAAVITSTTNCWYSIGATAVAHGAASDYLPAGLKLKVKFAAGQTISVIQDTAAGFLSITPASNPNISPALLDTVPAAVAAYSLRLVNSAYLGACINVRRSSDNSTQAIGFTSSGDLDVATMNAFIGAGSGFVATWYDQSGNGNNAVQATAVNQPPVTASLAAFKGRPALFGGASDNALALSAPAAASINNPFAAGGSVAMVLDVLGSGANADRFFDKTNVFCFFQGGTWQLYQIATTSGLWNSNTSVPVGGHVMTIAYSSASVANVPTFQFDATTAASFVTQQTAGTITSDAGQPLFLGNNSALTLGMNAYMGEFILWNTAVPLSAVQLNQRAYWGTP